MIQIGGSGHTLRLDEAGLDPTSAAAGRPALPRTDRHGGKHIALVKNSGWHVFRHSGDQIQALLTAGWRVTAIADFTSGGQEVFEWEIETRNVFFERSGTHIRMNLVCVSQLALILRELRPDIVHCFGVKEIIHGGMAARIAGVRAVVHTVTGQGILAAEGHAALRRLLQTLLRGALRGRSPVIFQNREDREDWIRRRLVAPERTVHIPGCGVNVRGFGNPPHRPQPTRFVMAARMLWSKGVAEFVNAAEIVRSICPEAGFDLFGGSAADYGSTNPDYVPRSWLEELNRAGLVRWHGKQPPDTVENALRSADTVAAVLLSRYAEGVPRFLIEAAACGLPIITTNTPGCRDVVEDGASGWLCWSAAEAAVRMVDLLRFPRIREHASSRAREIAMSFDCERVFADTLSVYDRAMMD